MEQLLLVFPNYLYYLSLNMMNCLTCDSGKFDIDRKLQLLALGVFCKLLQKIESADVVNCCEVFIFVK